MRKFSPSPVLFFIAILICCILLLGPKKRSWGTDYAGIWKRDCSNYYGLQIKLVEDRLYSVSFCGLDGCFEPGEWTPNTQIEGDPKYKVVSPRKLGIKRKDDGYFYYEKCDNDPTWLVAEPTITAPKEPLDCSFVTTSKEEGVLIAWVTNCRKTTQFGVGMESKTTIVGSFRPVAVIDGQLINKTLGASIYKGQSFWNVLHPTSNLIKLSSVGSFLDHMDYDHCVYFGALDNTDVPKFTLLSSKPLDNVFRIPSETERNIFYQLNTSCVDQGDYPKGEKPPCVRPKILAVSDINNNGKLEYWATEPYIWDTGLTVWENNDKLTPILQVCVGCSD